MKKKYLLVILMLFVVAVLISGCEGKNTGILAGDTTCNMPETWQGRFVAGADTVKDTKKDMIWEKSGKSGVSWQKANAYCVALKTNGLTWRLPTIGEFNAILGKCPQENDCRLDTAFDAPCGIFWVDKTTTYKDAAQGGKEVNVYGFVDAKFGGSGYDTVDERHLVKCVSSK